VTLFIIYTYTQSPTQYGSIIMGRSRYVITEADQPHFMTCTVVEWLPVFTRPETVQIILNCWKFQQTHKDCY